LFVSIAAEKSEIETLAGTFAPTVYAADKRTRRPKHINSSVFIDKSAFVHCFAPTLVFAGRRHSPHPDCAYP
jgi:hypothetical protein